MHSRTDNKSARPQGDAPSQTQVVFLSTPCDPRYRLFPPRAKDSKRNESNQWRGWEWGRAPSFRRKPESSAWRSVGRVPRQRMGDRPPLRLSGGSRNPGVGRCGAHPDTNPFPRRHHPRYPHSMHSRTDKNERPPQGDAPAQPQVVFLSTPPTPDTGCFLPVQKTRNETNPTSGGAGSGSAPRPSSGSRNPGVGRCGATLTPTLFLDDTIPATLPPCTAAPTTMAHAPKAMRPHNLRLFSYLHPRLQIPVVSSPRKRLETKRIQPAEGLGVGAPPPHHSLEGRDPAGWSGMRSRRGSRNGASEAAYRGGAWNRP